MPSTVGTSTYSNAVQYAHQRKAFYANGRFWVFYGISTKTIVYRTSVDGSSWSDEITIGTAYPTGFSIYFDGTYFHYARAPGSSGDSIFYRRGTPQSDGTINWSSSEQEAIQGTSGHTLLYPSITVDSNGYVFIAYRDQDDSDSNNNKLKVTKSGNNDGTWGSGSTWEIATMISPFGIILPLTNGRMYIVYNNQSDHKNWGKLYDGTNWGNQEGNFGAATGTRFNAVAIGDDVHLVWSQETVYDLRYKKRTYGVGWGDTITIQSSVTSSTAPVLSYEGTTLYCFWTGSPSANHIYYKKCINGTWDTNPTDWIDETTDELFEYDRITCFYNENNDYIGLVYLTKKQSPYNVRFGYLSLTQLIFQSISILNNIGLETILKIFSIIHRIGISIISDFSENLDKGFLVEYVSKKISGLFKITSRIYKLMILEFDILKRIFHYLILNFNILSYKIKELFVTFSLKTIIIKNLSIIHSIITKIIKIITVQYSLSLFVKKILNIGFNLISRIFKSISLTWLIKNLRLRVFVLTNKIRESIISVFTLFHSLVERLLRILNISYSSELFVEVLMNLSYFLIVRVKKTFFLVNDVLSYISRSISSLFKIREFRESLLVLLNNIKNIIRKTIKILYLSKRVVYSLFSTSYKIKKLLIKIFISISDISITEIIYKIQNISYSLAGLLGKLLLINYTIKEFLSSIFKILYSIKIFIGRIVLFNYLAKQYTIVSTILKYNTRKFIRSVSKILYNNLKYLTSIFEVVYIVPKVIVTIFLILNHIIKRISTIFSTLYSVGFLKIYSILSLKFGVISILTLKLKQILPRFKLSTLQKTLKVKLDTLKYRIKEILRRG